MIKKSNIVFKHFILLTIILASLFFIAGCSLLDQPDTIPIDNSKAIIVAVDGLSFVNTYIGTTIETSKEYLQPNLEKLINSESVRQFHWEGDADKSASIIGSSSDSGLRKFLIDNYNEAKSKNKVFIVISHSWGTFLSYLALSLEPTVVCDLFITLSCPLGTASGVSDNETIVRTYTDARLTEMSFDILGTSIPNSKVFYNFWANGDLISGSLTGKISSTANVQDVKVDDGISDGRTIPDCYFWHKFTTLGDEVITVTDPSYAVYTAYLATILPLPYDIKPTRNVFINRVVALIQTASGY